MSVPADGQAAAMDRMYRFQRHVYDATRRYYLLGRDQLVEDLRVPPGGSVLEVGCGTGRNLVKVAATYPESRVFGFDISAEMLKSASRAVLQSPDRSRIQIAQADAVSFDPSRVFGTGSFDRIFFSYTLSMIPGWEPALRQAVSLLSPGGELHIADFGQCEDLPALARRLLFVWLAQFGVKPRITLFETCRHIARANALQCHYRTAWKGYAVHLSLTRQ